jgi:hypothetical protein
VAVCLTQFEFTDTETEIYALRNASRYYCLFHKQGKVGECSKQLRDLKNTQNFGRRYILNAGADGSIMLCPCGSFCLLYFEGVKLGLSH